MRPTREPGLSSNAHGVVPTSVGRARRRGYLGRGGILRVARPQPFQTDRAPVAHGMDIRSFPPTSQAPANFGHLTRRPLGRSEPLLPLTHRDPDLLLLQVELGHERGHLLVLKVLPVIGQKLRACRLDGRQTQVEPRG